MTHLHTQIRHRCLRFWGRFLSPGFFVVWFATSVAMASEGQNCALERRPVAIVASGGTSLGAYQAGAMARLLEALKAQSTNYELKLLAGASAGGINSLLAFQDHCSEKGAQKSSWLYRFWTAPVAASLFAPEEKRISLLNPLAFDAVSRNFFKDWEQSTHRCDLVLSIPLTLKQPEKFHLSGGQTSNSQFLNFSLRARPGHPSELTNYANPFENSLTSILDLESQAQAEVLSSLARATSSIPIIFPAQKISYCSLKKEDPGLMQLRPPFRCPSQQKKVGEFIDGALLDATPLATSIRLLKRGLVNVCQPESGQPRHAQWIPVPRVAAAPALNSQLLIISLDVRNRLKPRPAENKLSLTGGVTELLGDLLQSARDRELMNLLDSEGEVRHQILSLRSHFPRWSEEWNGFFGFFDQDLRSFDYWVGYIDMEESLHRGFPDLLGQTPRPRHESLLPDCLRATIRHETSPACTRLSPNERILFAALSSEDATPPHDQRQARSLFNQRMEKLSQAEFEFDELGLSKTQTARAPTQVRGWIGQSSRNLAKTFPGDSGTTLDAVSGFLFGLTDPIPADKFMHMVWGSSFEWGYSHLVSIDYKESRFWRWPLVVELLAPRALSTSNEEAVSATLLSGIELQKPDSSSLDYLVSLRVGYQFSNQSDQRSLCQAGQIEACEGFSFSPSLAAVFFGTLRLQTGVKITWDKNDPKNINSTALFSGGLQF